MAEQTFLTYKGKPLVRKGDTVYYGDTSEKYIVMLKINSTKKVGDVDVADKVTVSLMLSDPDVAPKDRIVKKIEKNGYYSAIEVGVTLLERALEGK